MGTALRLVVDVGDRLVVLMQLQIDAGARHQRLGAFGIIFDEIVGGRERLVVLLGLQQQINLRQQRCDILGRFGKRFVDQLHGETSVAHALGRVARAPRDWPHFCRTTRRDRATQAASFNCPSGQVRPRVPSTSRRQARSYRLQRAQEIARAIAGLPSGRASR